MHTLSDERGSVLEAVVTRMKTVAGSPSVAAKGWPASRLRIVALSATLPNLTDVAAWIGAPRAATFSFDASFRPVPLTTHVIGYDSRAAGACRGGAGGEGEGR